MPSRYYGLAVLFAVLLVLSVFTALAWWMSRGRDWWTERQWRKENMRANERYAAYILNTRKRMTAVKNGRTMRNAPELDGPDALTTETGTRPVPRNVTPIRK